MNKPHLIPKEAARQLIARVSIRMQNEIPMTVMVMARAQFITVSVMVIASVYGGLPAVSEKGDMEPCFGLVRVNAWE